MDKNILKKLVSLANTLDSKGFYDEAKGLDYIIYTHAGDFGPEWDAAQKDTDEYYNSKEGLESEINAYKTQNEGYKNDLKTLRDYVKELTEYILANGDPKLKEFESSLYEKYYA